MKPPTLPAAPTAAPTARTRTGPVPTSGPIRPAPPPHDPVLSVPTEPVGPRSLSGRRLLAELGRLAGGWAAPVPTPFA